MDEIKPYVALPPWTPFTAQRTLEFVVPETVAVNCCEVPPWMVAVVGEIEIPTEPAAGITVTVVDADFVVSAMLVAVTVAVALGLDTVVGAVYMPVDEMLPTPVMDQVTPDVLPDTVALNCICPPTCITGDVGEIATDTVGWRVGRLDTTFRVSVALPYAPAVSHARTVTWWLPTDIGRFPLTLFSAPAEYTLVPSR